MTDIKIYKIGKPGGFYLKAVQSKIRRLKKCEETLLLEFRPELLTDDNLRMLVIQPHSLKQIGINI